MTTERNSRTQMWTPFLMKKGFHMSSRLRTHLNKMELLKGRIGHSSKWRERCLMSTRRQSTFWAEAVETAFHATNRLYLHKLLGKTACEFLTGNKAQVGYFRVFGSKCYILDKHRRSKFAPKSHEGFLHGYGSNSHTYRVYNNFT